MAKTVKLSELTPDPHNANKGTERGRYMVGYSLEQFGAGRSILLDKHGRIIAGNKTTEAAADAGIEDVIIVETDGKQLVAVKRNDLDLADGDQARLLAYADNRAGQVGLEWDAEAILADVDAGLDLSGMFFDEEIEGIVDNNLTSNLSEPSRMGVLSTKKGVIRPVISIDNVNIVEKAIAMTGKRNRGEALVEICKRFVDEEGQLYPGIEGFFEAGVD